jgi:uncharacterized RDD family membrane protein YckC
MSEYDPNRGADPFAGPPAPPAGDQNPYGQPPHGAAQPGFAQPGSPQAGFGPPAGGQAPAAYAPPRYAPPVYAQAAPGAPGKATGLPPGVVPGSMGDRLLATIIDVAIGTSVFSPLTVLTLHSRSAGVQAIVHLLGLVMGYAYTVGMLSRYGATIGKQAMGLRVVQLANGKNPSLGTCLVRQLAFEGFCVLGILALCIGIFPVLLSPLFDKSGARRGWWDRTAGTVIIKTARPQ